MRIVIAFFLVLLAPLAGADDRCTAQGRAEQARIERDFASKRPTRGDRDAEATWARNVDAALFENLEDGAPVDKFVEWFPGVSLAQARAVLEHAARSALAV
mgnify:CR=1 FL=1